jgi:hypothetical protein
MTADPSDSSPRIVQLLMTPQDQTWQNRMIGLGSDGVTYSVNHKGFWEPFVPPLGVTENAPDERRSPPQWIRVLGGKIRNERLDCV